MNDDFLKQYRKPPRPEFSAALYQRIAKPFPAPRNPFAPRRLALATLSLAVILGLVITFSPAAQTFAASMIRKIGAIALIDRSGTAEEPLSSPKPTSQPPAEVKPGFTENESEIARLAGFQPAVPAHLPEGYAPTGPWSIVPLDESTSVYREYRDPSGEHFLVFNPVLHPESARFEQEYSDNELVSDLTIRGQPGVWITGRLFSDRSGTLIPTNWLMWAEARVNYTLYSDALPLDEMLAVAEALH